MMRVETERKRERENRKNGADREGKKREGRRK